MRIQTSAFTNLIFILMAEISSLRAIIRALLATSPPSVTASFNVAAKNQLIRRQQHYSDVSDVFVVDKNSEILPGPAAKTTLAYVRSLYGAGMAFQSITILTSIIRATLGFTWQEDGVMSDTLAEIDADISQAIQSCREELASKSDKATSAKETLQALLNALGDSRREVEMREGEFPFERGLANAENLRC